MIYVHRIIIHALLGIVWPTTSESAVSLPLLFQKIYMYVCFSENIMPVTSS